MSRRALILALAIAVLWPPAARSQDFPNRPIRLIVPFAAGGAADLFARSLASGLGAELGRQAVGEARAGAGGLTGVDVAAKSAADGYTICLAGAAALSAIPFMTSKMPFDWQKDLALLTLVVRVPEVLVVHPSLGVGTLPELIAYARANPGKINYGSAGAGTLTHLPVELLKAAAGIDLAPLPYPGRAGPRRRAAPLPRRRPGGERSPRRPRAAGGARHAGPAAAYPLRRGQGAGGHLGGAQPGAAGGSDHRRGRAREGEFRQLVQPL